jgi:hypothetical protein
MHLTFPMHFCVSAAPTIIQLDHAVSPEHILPAGVHGSLSELGREPLSA